jgi:alpha-galactosidase
LSFRAATALFGWLGVEWNVLRILDKERDNLRTAIAVYKEHRDLIHSGNFIRVDHPDETIDIRGVLSDDGSEGLFSVSRLRSGPSNHSAPLRIPVDGLFDYRVSIVQLGSPRWALHRQLPQWVRNGTTDIDARMLGHIGLPMPSLLPESSFLIRLERVVSS